MSVGDMSNVISFAERSWIKGILQFSLPKHLENSRFSCMDTKVLCDHFNFKELLRLAVNMVLHSLEHPIPTSDKSFPIDLESKNHDRHHNCQEYATTKITEI